MKQQQSITTLPPSPEEDRRARVIRYSLAMGVRMVCIILCFFVTGWWLFAAVIGAIVLPYFAVIAANVSSQRSQDVLRPGSIVPVARPASGDSEA